MYRHILTLIDCTDESRRLAQAVADYFALQTLCKVTVAACVSATPDGAPAEVRTKKVEHAEEALQGAYDILLRSGIMARRRLVLEGDDFAASVAAAADNPDQGYDLIVLGTHHARVEEFEPPCRGSIADAVIRRAPVPVLVLPTGPGAPHVAKPW
jgi:nucleotide-binding universal stress UspA family protein